jgi:hypothetical protein
VPKLDGQAAEIQTSMIEARNTVNDALEKPDAPAELANAYGELGGLYQTSFMRQSAEQCFRMPCALIRRTSVGRITPPGSRPRAGRPNLP